MSGRKLLWTLSVVGALLVGPGTSAQDLVPEGQRLKAYELAQQALAGNLAWDIVESLTTEVGPRLAGTESEARARDWAVAKLEELGFSNVRVEAFPVPRWTRGIEQAEILSPYPQSLVVTALAADAERGR